MSFVRDFAMAGNCGENAMNSFLNGVDKSTSQLDLWQRDFHSSFQEEDKQLNLPHGFEQGFHYPEMPGQFDQYDEFEDYERIWDQPFPQNEFFQIAEVNPIINNLLHDFLNFSAANKILPPKQLKAQELQLSHEEVDKIVERSGTIARHFCATQHNYNLMTRQLDNLFRSLGIHVDPRELLNRQSMGDWEREFQQFHGPQFNNVNFDQYNRVWNQEHRNLHQLNQWHSEYQNDWKNYNGPALSEDEEKLFNKTFNETSSAWANEYSQEEDDERAEEERWFSKFVGGPTHSNNNVANNAWADEFNGQSGVAGQWVNEFQQEMDAEFQSLTNRVKEIPFEKLQKSKFVEFVDKVKNKEVNLPDLQMKVMED